MRGRNSRVTSWMLAVAAVGMGSTGAVALFAMTGETAAVQQSNEVVLERTKPVVRTGGSGDGVGGGATGTSGSTQLSATDSAGGAVDGAASGLVVDAATTVADAAASAAGDGANNGTASGVNTSTGGGKVAGGGGAGGGSDSGGTNGGSGTKAKAGSGGSTGGTGSSGGGTGSSGGSGPTTTAPPEPAGPAFDNPCEQDVFDRMNVSRHDGGVRTLLPGAQGHPVSHDWSEHMGGTQSLQHNPNYASELEAHGVNWKTVGENIGTNTDLADLASDWMNSSVHRGNIMNGGFTHASVGCAQDARGAYWVTVNFWS